MKSSAKLKRMYRGYKNSVPVPLPMREFARKFDAVLFAHWIGNRKGRKP